MNKKELQDKINKGFIYHLIHFDYKDILFSNLERFLESGFEVIKNIGICLLKVIIIVLFPITSIIVVLLIWDSYKTMLKNYDKDVEDRMNRLFRKNKVNDRI